MPQKFGRIAGVAGFVTLLLLLMLPLSTPTPLEAQAPQQVAPGAVVINEVGWMGTAASAWDEWIELYNTTAITISLSNWTISFADGTPNTIVLNGLIAPHGYYLLERAENATNIVADQIYGGAQMSNAGETMTLRDQDGAVIDTANGDGGGWPAGTASPSYFSMERINPLAPDTDANWASNNGSIRNGLDANGNPINGTPRARNSVTPIPQPDLADLRVVKSGPATALTGATITYTLRIHNDGQLAAASTRVTDTLPAGVSFVSSIPAPAFTSGQAIVWNLGSLASGAQQQITLTGNIVASATGMLVNRLAASTTTTESTLLNNTAVWTTTLTAEPPPPAQVLINAVLFDGYAPLDIDEAVQLINLSDQIAQLNGWELCKYTTVYACRPLSGMQIPAHGKIWITRDLDAFQQSFGFVADYLLSPWLSNGLANGGDEVILRDASQTVVDSLVYGTGETNIFGWSGPALTMYQNNVGRAEGQILHRIPDEVSGLPIPDTNTQADWMQFSGDVAYGRRVVYPGWDFIAPFFWPATATEEATLMVGVLPDNGYEIISRTLALAQESIKIEVYALRHGVLVDTLIAKAQAGVEVTVLLEGSQVGVGETDIRWQGQLYACQLLEAAGGKCYFMIHDTTARIFNRYDFLHGKFIVVDDRWLVVTSQNFNNTSLPADDKSNGTFGSRGVVVATNAPTIVARASAVFDADCDPLKHNDILRWNTGGYTRYGLPAAPVDLYVADAVSYTVTIPAPLVLTDTFAFELLTAPEAALRQRDALLGMVARAGVGDKVYVQQLYEYHTWGSEPLLGPNLRLEAYIQAARRGAQVRILLNSGNFGQEYFDLTRNNATVAYVNQLARAEALDLRAAMGDPTAYGLHNKMVLVGLHNAGSLIHVGSINGSESSSKVNREMALQVQSDAAYAYLEAMFLADWYRSTAIFLPLVLREYTPPQRVLISEVYYATGDVNREWVEIYNPTGLPVDLSAYKIGDAASPEDYEAMYLFPPGTVIQPRQVLVIAVSGRNTPQAHFELIDDSDKPNMIRVPDWGTGNWNLANGGDQVLLLGPDNVPVDVVVWGTASYPGVIPHPGVSVFTSSLERFPPDRDTDDCSVDFRERAAPNPGVLP